MANMSESTEVLVRHLRYENESDFLLQRYYLLCLLSRLPNSQAAMLKGYHGNQHPYLIILVIRSKTSRLIRFPSLRNITEFSLDIT